MIKFWILLAVVGTFLIGGCIMPLPAMACLDTQNKTIETQLNTCKQMSPSSAADACLERLALDTDNSAVCAEKSSSLEQNLCYEHLAIKYQNVGYCNLIVNGNDECKRYANDSQK